MFFHLSGSRAPMLVEEGKEETELQKTTTEKDVEKVSLKGDNISLASNAESLREQNVFKYKNQVVIVKKMQRFVFLDSLSLLYSPVRIFLGQRYLKLNLARLP